MSRLFVPSTQYQNVPDWLAMPNGGEYQTDFATGHNRARWDCPPGPEYVIDKRTGRPQTESVPTLVDVKKLLPGAILLTVNPATKGPIRKEWQKTDFHATQTPDYQAELEAAETIGVLLGPPSGSLIDLDCDTEAFRDEMLTLNPTLSTTLRTCGERGAGIWFYLVGNYPEGIFLFDLPPEHRLAKGGKSNKKTGRVRIGELRSGGGCHSVIIGRHRCGVSYVWPVPNPPIQLHFPDLVWPSDIKLPWLPQTSGEISTEKKTTTTAAEPSNGLLARAIALLPIDKLWSLLGLDGKPNLSGRNVCSPFRKDKQPSFSVYDSGLHFKDHGTGEHGDSFDFFQLAKSLDPKTAFIPFVELAGLGTELKVNADTVQGSNGQHPPGSTPSTELPQLILPSADIGYSITASNMFPVLAKRLRYFVRGRAIVEIAHQKLMRDKQFHTVFELLEPDALRSRIEQDFRLSAWREDHGQYKLKPVRCNADVARVLLKTDEAYEFLPSVVTLSAVPVLSEEQGALQILYSGYHDCHGGIFVTGGPSDIILPSLEIACRLILGALNDYDFVSESDKSRAVASFLSPAMRAGRLLGDVDFPIDIGEADESQSGKTFRHKMIHAVYGETPYIIANRDGGVGSLDESISSALVAGIPFIFFENFRGQMRSQLAETCLRGTGMAPARVPHRGEVQMPTGHINWQLSSNGLEATRDFVNRSIITRIAKRENGYHFKDYQEGNILAHIRANQADYLGAVFRVLIAWDEQGRQKTDETRHDFSEWAQSLDWIVQTFFGLPSLLEGHTEEVLRVSDPALSWLRQVAIGIAKEKRLDEALSASEILDICHARGIQFPDAKVPTDSDHLAMYVGRLLNRLFRDSAQINIDRYQIRKESREEYRPSHGNKFTKHYYWFELRKGVLAL